MLSSVSNSSLTSVWASVVAHGSLLVHRSSFTSSSDAVILIASTPSFEDLCRVEESSSKSEEDTLWRRFWPLVLEPLGHDFPAHREWRSVGRFDLNEWSACRSQHSTSQMQPVY